MFQKSVALVFASLAVTVAMAAQETANDKDKKALQGKWKVVSITRGPDILTPTDRYWAFEGEIVKTNTAEKPVSSTFTIDAGKSPKAIDMKYKELGSRLCIYELKGDDLKLCLIDVSGAPRPKEFSSTDKNGQTLMVFKRVK
jgi:uncharacterized protein (TIGR03067 family)